MALEVEVNISNVAEVKMERSTGATGSQWLTLTFLNDAGVILQEVTAWGPYGAGMPKITTPEPGDKP